MTTTLIILVITRNARPKESDIKVKPEFDYELPAYSFSLIEI